MIIYQIIYLIINGIFLFVLPPSQENIEKIIETPTTDNMMKQEVKEVSQHSVGKNSIFLFKF